MTTWKESNVLQVFTTWNSTEIMEPFQQNHGENEWFPKKDDNQATMKIINLGRESILGSSKTHSNYSSGLIISIIRNQMDNSYLLSVFGAWVFIYSNTSFMPRSFKFLYSVLINIVWVLEILTFIQSTKSPTILVM